MFSVLPQTVREADVSATEKYGVPALGLMKAAAKESLRIHLSSYKSNQPRHDPLRQRQ